MKIEKLAFKNINSLAGEYEIDFRNPALTREGMFAITGPTGAGKTTILDAVSFALYACTPRQEKTPQKERNEIMTYGTDECYATVWFEQHGEHYCSRVSHHRARRKDATSPFSGVEYRLHKLNTDGAWQLLADKATAFEKNICDIMGLSFENFRRSMLLPQGDFAAFLKAGDKERAEVLTTITGTEIYDRIGRIAHERAKAVQDKYEALHLLDEMPADVRETKEAARDAADASLKELAARLEHVRNCIKWVDDEARQKKNVEDATQKAEEAVRALKAFEDGSAAVLKRAESVRLIKSQAEKLADSMQQEKRLRDNVATKKKELTAAVEALEKLADAEATAAAELKAAAPELQESLCAVQTEMRPQETELALLKRSVCEKSQENDKKQKAHRLLQIRMADLSAQLKKEKTALQKHQDELKNVADAAALGERLPLIEARLNDWLAAPKVAGPLPAHARIEADLAAAQAELTEAESRPSGLREVAQLLRSRLAIEDKLAALYLDFCDGKLDRCPCCGSATPGERHAVRDEELKAAEDAVLRAEKAVKDCRDKVKTLETLLGVSTLRLAFVAALGAEVEDLSAARQQVKDLKQRHDTYTTLMTELQENEKKCAKLKVDFDKESARAEEVKRSAIESAGQLADVQAKYTERQEKFTARWGDGATADALEKQTSAALTALQKKAEVAGRNLADARLAETEIRAAHGQLEQQLPELQTQVEKQKTAFAAMLKEQGFAAPADYVNALNKDLPQLEKLRNMQTLLNEKQKTTAALQQREAAALAELRDSSPLKDGETEESLTDIRGQLEVVQKEQMELYTTLLAQLSTDDQAREANAVIKAEKESLQHELDQHTLLKKVLGGSQDGFKKFAQQITFDLLLRRANVELRQFTSRYELCRAANDKSQLGISVIDHELGITEGRPASNLSGGESFLVSLSLALGLSHLSQATRIDTLFLDEGFGTLDADTLEHVLSALQKLQSTGKTIGIISHVAALSERLAARIQVERTRSGFSTLTGNPAVKCLSAL